MNELKFEQTPISIVDQEGQPWFLGKDIAKALGFDDPKHLNQIYNRNAEEFQDVDTRILNLRVQNDIQAREHRIYSKTGAYLVAMFAKTEKAAKFRRWLIDVLEGKVSIPGYEDLARYRDIVLNLQEELIESEPNFAEHIRLANQGESWLSIARKMKMTPFQVRQCHKELLMYGYEFPEVDQHLSRAAPQDVVPQKNAYLIDDTAAITEEE